MSTRGWQDVSAADLARMQRKGPPSAKPSKYRNVRVVVDGESFDSKREAQQWAELKMREKAGQISQLKRQVKFPLLCPGRGYAAAPRDYIEGVGYQVVADYIADFTFVADGEAHVQDVKGGRATKTALYQLKKKWLYLQSGIEIEEIG